MKYFGLEKDVFALRGYVDGYNAAVGAVVAFLTMLFGEYWFLFAGFALLNLLDWVTGGIKATNKKRRAAMPD